MYIWIISGQHHHQLRISCHINVLWQKTRYIFHEKIDFILRTRADFFDGQSSAAILIHCLTRHTFQPRLRGHTALAKLVEGNFIIIGSCNINIVIPATSALADCQFDPSGEYINRFFAGLTAALDPELGGKFRHDAPCRCSARGHATCVAGIQQGNDFLGACRQFFEADFQFGINKSITIHRDQRFRTSFIGIVNNLSASMSGIINKNLVARSDPLVQFVKRLIHSLQSQLFIMQPDHIFSFDPHQSRNRFCACDILRHTLQLGNTRLVITYGHN